MPALTPNVNEGEVPETVQVVRHQVSVIAPRADDHCSVAVDAVENVSRSVYEPPEVDEDWSFTTREGVVPEAAVTCSAP